MAPGTAVCYICGVILEKDFTCILEMASVAFRDGQTSRGAIIEALKKAEVSLYVTNSF